MRITMNPPALLSLLLAVLSQTNIARGGPVSVGEGYEADFSLLQNRDCVSSGGFWCGLSGEFCCSSGQTCDNTEGCQGGSGSGGYAVYTTTFTETDLILRTSTYSSYWQVATTTYPTTTYVVATNVPAVCASSLGQQSCGIYCCASDQTCLFSGSCTARSTLATSASLSAPVKGTSSTGTTVTATASVTTTQGFIPAATASNTSFPITSTSTSGGLSAGAIAGIVIGVIAAVIILILICFCCILKTGIDGLLAIFGLGKKRRSTERVEVIEERYSRHGSASASRRPTHTGWFGGSRPTRVTETRKKSSGLGGLGMVGAGLLGMAAILGLKRRNTTRSEKTSGPAISDVSSSYYSYTDTSASSASSDRRTRDTRGTRNTRDTRGTRNTRGTRR